MNVWEWIIGNPENKAADDAFKKAVLKLKKARALGDQVGQRVALAEMKKAAAQSSATAKGVVSNVDAIDSTVESVKEIASITTKVTAIVAVIAVVFILRK